MATVEGVICAEHEVQLSDACPGCELALLKKRLEYIKGILEGEPDSLKFALLMMKHARAMCDQPMEGDS